MGVKKTLPSIFLFLSLSAMIVVGSAYQGLLILILFIYFTLSLPKLILPREVILSYVSFMFLLCLSLGLGGNLDFSSIRYIIQPILEGILIATFLFYIFKINNKDKLNNVIFGYICIQFFFFCIMVLFPDLRRDILEKTYSFDILQGKDSVEKAFLFRGFGISKQHLFAFSILVSTMLITYLFSENKFKKKVLMVVFCLPLILLNARTGVVGILLFITIYCFSSIKSLWKSIFFTLTVLAIIIAFINSSYFDQSNFYIKWFSDGITQFTSKSEGHTTTSDLSNMINLPDTFFNLMFGYGSPCGTGTACRSDIGYIRLIQTSGVISLLCFIVLIFFVSKEHASVFFADNKKKNIMFFLFIFFSFFIYMIKGDAYGLSDYSRYIYMMGFLNVYFQRENKKVVLLN